jgi:DNA-binding Lrp family transcriptional regulator
MWDDLDILDRRLLDGWQRDLPIMPRPFAEIGRALGLAEAEVLRCLARLSEAGAISRVGATTRPNTAAASTLAAVAAPTADIERVAAQINATPGVNHSYLRENRWNIWFVATGPDRGHVDDALGDIERRTGLQVLDLRLVRPFNVDLGFSLIDRAPSPPARPADPEIMRPGDADILQALSSGLPLVTRPYEALAAAVGRDEAHVLARIRALLAGGIIGRLGVIVRHRALGWTSNPMVVWALPHEVIDTDGPCLAAQPGVTLCYERRPVSGVWPYTLYAMFHARSRAEALEAMHDAAAAAGISDAPSEVLFSLRCFRQRGALISAGRAA